MTDTASPAATPLQAVEALRRHVPLNRREWFLAYLFVTLLRDALPTERASTLDGSADPVVELVASEAFGRHLAARVRSSERGSVALAFLQLVMDRESLRGVITDAGLQTAFLIYDCE